ncbi:hypothetical protein [Herbaspirillum huttiense]|uniref:hypothetical protein n=1 Tax=Herbaspirillum huttiense TaxID=863372 RepID=UPI0039AF2ABB
MAQKNDILIKCANGKCKHQGVESQWLPKQFHTSCGISSTSLTCPKCGCVEYYDLRPQVAWCWASGLIEIGDKAPAKEADGSGAIAFAQGPKAELNSVLGVCARHGLGASEGKLLVPGVPEAADQDAAADALFAWLKWCSRQKYGAVEFLKLGV